VSLPAATPTGRLQGVQTVEVTTHTTFEDGKAQTTGGKCASWVLPAGAPFMISGVCNYTEAKSPLYAVVYSCEATGALGANCWGELIGQGEDWKGRIGTVAFFNSNDGSSRGVGQWN
jgi:hypothetical protein